MPHRNPNHRLNGAEKRPRESEQLLEFTGLAAEITRRAASDKVLPRLLQGESIVFFKKSLNNAKLQANYPNPFDHECNFHLEYSPEKGFVVGFEPDNSQFATYFAFDKSGKVIWYDDQFVLDPHEVRASGKRFVVQNAKPGDDLESLAQKMAQQIVRNLIQFAELEKDNPAMGR